MKFQMKFSIEQKTLIQNELEMSKNNTEHENMKKFHPKRAS